MSPVMSLSGDVALWVMQVPGSRKRRIENDDTSGSSVSTLIICF